MKTFAKLKKEYENKGIRLVYRRSGRKYSLSIIGAPFVVEGIENEKGSCQLTGSYMIYSKEQLQDVDTITLEAIEECRRAYAGNDAMLSYIQEGVKQ